MKNTAYFILIVFALLVVGIVPVFADGHGGHGGHGHWSVWIGPGWGLWDPWWWGAPYYPYSYCPYGAAYPYYSPQRPSEYVEPTPQEEQTYWYFCPDAKNYYPYVKQCPSGWLKVIPSVPPDQREQIR